MSASKKPAPDDLVVRREKQRGRPTLVLHRVGGPDQVIVRSRDEALAQGLRFAKRLNVRLWFSDGAEDFTLVEDFRRKGDGAAAAEDELVHRVRAEFLEMPGLRLTVTQAKRLWAVDAVLCQAILEALVNLKFLSRHRDGSYSRLSDGRPAA